MVTVDVRCDRCGKPVSLDAEPGSVARCPRCGNEFTVPPAPGVSAARNQLKAGTSSSQPAPPLEPADQKTAGEDKQELMAALSRVLPWVVSAFLHVGLLLVFALLTMVVIQNRIPEEVIVPDAFLSSDPGGVVMPGDRSQ